MSCNYDWEIQNLKSEINRINNTLYGNGEGLTSRMNGSEDEIHVLMKWHDNIQRILSIEELKKMKERVEKLTHDRWFILGLFSGINVLVVIFGPKLAALI